MTKMDGLKALVESESSRREFARRVMLGGAAAGVVAAVSPIINLSAQSVTDVDILNFALNLEYLEAEFYTVATTGQRIADAGVGITGTGRAGETVGGSRVSLNDRQMTVATQIALDERNHVNFIRLALGNAAVAKPAINLAALNVGFNNANEFLTVARAFEDLGVSAYGGAAASISNRNILTNATQIALTEAQHAGVLRLLVSDAGIAVPPVDAMDILPLMSPNGRLFQVDGAGRSTIRTPGQVLAVAYGSAQPGTRAGGFFPAGVNGVIASV